MRLTHRPGSLLRRSCCLQGPIPKPDTYETHAPLRAGHAGTARSVLHGRYPRTPNQKPVPTRTTGRSDCRFAHAEMWGL